MSAQPALELVEYERLALPKRALSEAIGTQLWERYGTMVEVEFPSPKTGHCWHLTSLGWVGYLPLSDGDGVWLKPRVPLANLFRMLEYAYRLKSFKVWDGTLECQTLREFYERLAGMLAGRVLDRARQGLYRAYLSHHDALPFVRGRVALELALRRPWEVKQPCDFQEHTADLEDNQLLAWTLAVILRQGICSERTAGVVRRAFNALRGAVTLRPFDAQACVDRHYHRLNQDYQPIHALCRFFLEQSGPALNAGDRAMTPFAVWMPSLFELFVAEWLRAHLPRGLEVHFQERMNLGASEHVSFKADLVIREAATGRARAVLDTKYKIPDRPASDDVAQVMAYAQAWACDQAVLIYPRPLPLPLDERIQGVSVLSAAFSLDSDLELAGHRLLRALQLGPAIQPEPDARSAQG